MNQDDLKSVYFGYFDQLPEPWVSEAKANYTPKRAILHPRPSDLEDSLRCGIQWSETPQEYKYWSDIANSIASKWNYLPALPTDTSKVYEVACFAEDGSEWIELCTFDDSLGREAAQAHNLFARSTQNVTLNGLDLTPYAWRPVPPATIPPRPQ
jgi:hypothetical protein